MLCLAVNSIFDNLTCMQRLDEYLFVPEANAQALCFMNAVYGNVLLRRTQPHCKGDQSRAPQMFTRACKQRHRMMALSALHVVGLSAHGVDACQNFLC